MAPQIVMTRDGEPAIRNQEIISQVWWALCLLKPIVLISARRGPAEDLDCQEPHVRAGRHEVRVNAPGDWEIQPGEHLESEALRGPTSRCWRLTSSTQPTTTLWSRSWSRPSPIFRKPTLSSANVCFLRSLFMIHRLNISTGSDCKLNISFCRSSCILPTCWRCVSSRCSGNRSTARVSSWSPWQGSRETSGGLRDVKTDYYCGI